MAGSLMRTLILVVLNAHKLENIFCKNNAVSNSGKDGFT
jgi:hypothetical protein